MKVLLIYSSTEGHTASIANFIAAELRALHCVITVAKASSQIPSPTCFDAVVVAAPVHAGQYDGELVDCVSKCSPEINHIPSIFYSVGLTITSEDPRALESLEKTTTDFLKDTRWTPDMVEQVAGALLYTRYGFFKRMLMKSVMKKAGGDTDTSRDFIYTDWDALRASVRQFAGRFELIEH